MAIGVIGRGGTPRMRARPRGEPMHEAGLRAAYAAHGRELFGLAVRTLDDSMAAEEAVQETFLRAWRAGSAYDSRLGSLRTWLFAILRNVMIDMMRARAIRPQPAGETSETPADDRTLERVLESWQVEEALRKLSAEHREVLIEVFYRGQPYREVAAALHVPVGTVKSRIYYALRSLRLILEESGWRDV